jgi:small subunit ribosomal protein S19e
MTTAHDVPPELLIRSLSEDLKKAGVKPPEWAPYVKTGIHREKSPYKPDWWYDRLASVLRKVYLRGPVGTERLAAEYGGSRDAGSAPKHPRQGSRAIVRECLQQLEGLGYVKAQEKRGRVVTSKGRSLVDRKAREILTDLTKERKELVKYL